MGKVINTHKAPKAIGPYSQGIAEGNFVYTSGQLPLEVAIGALEKTDIKLAAKNSLENCRVILEEAGLSLKDVVKTLVFMTDLSEFAATNEVYASYFPENPPARSCVQVAALPLGAKIEIEVEALKA
ncbi:MAG: Rid family detoxifying hydrolase [Spirochaetaceae bacterium]|jgi:2-iminobutanoate/2-iminopropanoate deaminase|nr:Rid family detoxifying hydrolase [Spirochaetaceae bacterium]